MPARVLDELVGAVEAHGLGVEQGGQEGLRLVALEPGADPGEPGESRRVALGKAVFAEALELPDQAFGKVGQIAVPGHALAQALMEGRDLAAAAPGRHGAAQLVGLAGRKARRDHGQAHGLLLEDRNAQRALQDLADRGRGIVLGLQPLAAAQVGMDHAALHGAGPHDGHLDHQVVEAFGAQARQHAHLGAGFDLEHPDRVGLLDHVEGAGIVRRHLVQRPGPATAPGDQFRAFAQGAEHAQREDVDLEQAHGVEIVLVPLDDAAPGHGGVFQGHQLVEPLAGDHEAAGMLRQVARKAGQLAGQRGPDRALLGAQRLERAAHDGRVVDVAQAPGGVLDEARVDSQGLAGVPQGAAAPVGDDHGGQGGVGAPVAGVDILDNLLAAMMLEIHVDVGRLAALAADEPGKEQSAGDGIDLGDAQAVADHGVGRRTPALAQDALAAGVADQVVDRQEIGLVAQLADQRELVLELASRGGRHARGIAPGRARQAFVAQMARRRGPRRHAGLGILVAQRLE